MRGEFPSMLATQSGQGGLNDYISVYFRFATVFDLAKSKEIQIECGQSYKWLDFLADELHKKRITGLVVEAEEVPIGYILGKFSRKHKFDIVFWNVFHDFEETGLRFDLLDMLLLALRGRINTISLLVSEKDLQFQKALKAFGFEAVRVVRGGMSNTEDAYLFLYYVPSREGAASDQIGIEGKGG